MKWILIKMEERASASGPAPTLCLTWDNGITEITEYHTWHSYPEMPDKRLLKPGIIRAQRGPAFFKAPAGLTAKEIYDHNLKHYIASTQLESTEIEKLEKAAEEITEASDQRYLYWPG